MLGPQLSVKQLAYRIFGPSPIRRLGGAGPRRSILRVRDEKLYMHNESDEDQETRAGPMVLHGTTRLLKSVSKAKSRKRKPVTYERYLVHIPSKIVSDSMFPFRAGDELSIVVNPNGKIVLKA